MENVEEKLSIDERKIIHILLKQLMYQQNEFTYFKNKAGLQLLDNAIVVNGDGSKHLLKAIPEKEEGSNHLPEPMLKKEGGSNHLPKPTPEKKDGSNHLSEPTLKKEDGSNLLPKPTPEKEDGSNHLSEAMLKKEDGSNRDVWLYTVFEQELIIALGQYINNGNGQNSLYSFYTDFVEAVEQKNEAAIKMKEAEKNLTLEDTHLLPAEITVDKNAISLVGLYLYSHLPHNTNGQLYSKVALEVLYMHNNGKAKQSQLHELTGISVSGFAKHLRRLKQYDLIKELPSKYYALSDKSIHVLLKLYGKPKNK